jgi:hypothetical protein
MLVAEVTLARPALMQGELKLMLGVWVVSAALLAMNGGALARRLTQK